MLEKFSGVDQYSTEFMCSCGVLTATAHIIVCVKLFWEQVSGESDVYSYRRDATSRGKSGGGGSRMEITLIAEVNFPIV